jgi:hypothetical protein
VERNPQNPSKNNLFNEIKDIPTYTEIPSVYSSTPQDGNGNKTKRKKAVFIFGSLWIFITFVVVGLVSSYLTKKVVNRKESIVSQSTPSNSSLQTATPSPSDEKATADIEVIKESDAAITLDKSQSIIGEGPKTILECPLEKDFPFIITSDNVVIANMTIRNCKYGLKIAPDSEEGLRGILIYNVIFENNKIAGVFIENTTKNAPINFEITANTFVGGASGILINSSKAESSKIENNIFSNQSKTPVEVVSENDGGVNYSYNLFFGCNNGCKKNWHTGILSLLSTEKENVFDTNPLFTSPTNHNYSLRTGSPAIDAGNPSIYSNPLMTDGDGVPRLDIGAIEYSMQ